jgi:hypothetical protein
VDRREEFGQSQNVVQALYHATHSFVSPSSCLCAAQNVHTVAGVLKRGLMKLEPCLLPDSTFDTLIGTLDLSPLEMVAQLREAIQTLPSHRLQLLRHVVAFLRQVSLACCLALTDLCPLRVPALVYLPRAHPRDRWPGPEGLQPWSCALAAAVLTRNGPSLGLSPPFLLRLRFYNRLSLLCCLSSCETFCLFKCGHGENWTDLKIDTSYCIQTIQQEHVTWKPNNRV